MRISMGFVPHLTRFGLHCASCIATAASYHFESFQGWTSNSTIERLHRRSINPLPVTDMNKFFDDKAEPGIATDTRLGIRDSKNPYNEEIQVYELTGGVELVPLLTSRRYYSQSQNTRHVATDATRPGYTIDSSWQAFRGVRLHSVAPNMFSLVVWAQSRRVERHTISKCDEP
ncbi:hypothetical protein K0M31_018557 [Melipona bicolor]|uniref:Uncharacterized protein n=1 Tax=Melipona bicolor TaxID=60889 RepID=A0AA40G3K0_9HYME|nr:hypothetical protein K0M31_018557 [Melipona bicolor]